jgi:transcriptional regulator with XRE-family HTH domain
MTGKQIKKLRLAMGMTQVEFAERIGVCNGQEVSRLENEAKYPRRQLSIILGNLQKEVLQKLQPVS